MPAQNTQQAQRGFTLIELMIVVAIVGILAAVAIPSYRDYIKRTQMAEAHELLTATKTPLVDYYHNHGQWPSDLASVVGTVSGKYIHHLAIISGASETTASISLEAEFKSTGVHAALAGTAVQLNSTDGGKTWTW